MEDPNKSLAKLANGSCSDLLTSSFPFFDAQSQRGNAAQVQSPRDSHAFSDALRVCHMAAGARCGYQS